MSYQIQDVLNRARLDLNDATTAPVTGSAITPRYADADLLNYVNDGISKAVVMRPDLNYDNYGTGTYFTVPLVATSTFPLPNEYLAGIAIYTVFRVQSGDDAFVDTARADKALQLYIAELGV